MSDILTEIADSARKRYEKRKSETPLSEVKARISDGAGSPLEPFAFEKSLREAGFALICEIKKASPSRGVISADFPYLEKARDYERGGAAAISCLTEPEYFQGSDEIFADVRKIVGVPMLRKDFVVDEYQIYESKALGADAVLLISSLLSEEQMAEYLALARSLGLNALCECRDAEEVERAGRIGARVVGVNNRDLRDFSVDLSRGQSLLEYAPEGCIFIAESGIKSAKDVRKARLAGFDGVLMGEAPMRACDTYGFMIEVKECSK